MKLTWFEKIPINDVFWTYAGNNRRTSGCGALLKMKKIEEDLYGRNAVIVDERWNLNDDKFPFKNKTLVYKNID
jgi:hypothetical protein